MRVCRPWTAEDDAYLAANYATAPLWQMAKHLDRTVKALCKRAQESGLRRPHPGTKGRRYPNRRRPTVAELSPVETDRFSKFSELHQLISGWLR